ncbi:cofactor-independent phosphoglycerate mutase [Algisphaera agarilytica]|uniref:2,3-bisphosphoglycerate-independent phosphoglycerate mutase n=1 Tax=Algisphaera agarilytica TaxID=1385975 RepID=A0A7X0H756_9BACT|nr:cofactor-independent phosphoglycerate mutase [Algisphaera agarilytica]MBB6430527.1 2,3-bisphosphoglycerate-independent phosphoglycerate mutase [Algisphaera agarilytica]
MKYVLIIPDGAADERLAELGDQTPFEAADTPNLNKLAMSGRQGTAVTTPEGMPCGSDVCTMSLLGYDPRKYHKGRAPLEAAALGIEMGESDWIFRVNLVTVIDGKMQDHSAGHISSTESKRLLTEFAPRLDLDGVALYPGVSYRNIMIDRSGQRDWGELETTPPHDVPGEPIRKHLPVGGEHAKLLQQLIAESEVFLAEHEINLTRAEMGELPATHFWPWGQGQRPTMPSFESRFGLKGAMITAVDLLAGISAFIDWDRLDVPGQTSYHDNDYAATGEYAIKALDDYDIVCAHVEAPDEAGHAADPATKVASVASIDEHVIGPIHQALEAREAETGEPWRILLLPDHYTLVNTRKHDPTPVPFLMAGHKVHSVLQRTFSEENAGASDLHIDHGHELMEYFLKSGLG